MKKLISFLILTAMLLTLGAVTISAELPDGLSSSLFARGHYCVDNPDLFTPVGTIQIQWDPQVSEKLNLSDGDMTDWADNGYNPHLITTANMVAWGDSSADAATLAEGWNLTAYFVADSEWLYIGFYVADDNFVYGVANEDRYSGDTFQICIDFGNMLGDAVRAEPEFFPNPKNIFYSFCCYESDSSIRIKREESEDDRWLTEAAGDGVKGAAIKTSSGWSAEFALSWEMLHADYEAKAWLDDTKLYLGGQSNKPLQIGCCLYYLNGGGEAFWAAGTTNGITDNDGTPGVSWTCYDNGVNLELAITDEVSFNYDGIVILKSDETEPPEAERPTEAPIQTPDEPSAGTPTDDTTAEADTKGTSGNAGTQTPATQDGCSSVVGIGSVVLVSAVAAAFVLKKRD